MCMKPCLKGLDLGKSGSYNAQYFLGSFSFVLFRIADGPEPTPGSLKAPGELVDRLKKLAGTMKEMDPEQFR